MLKIEIRSLLAIVVVVGMALKFSGWAAKLFNWEPRMVANMLFKKMGQQFTIMPHQSSMMTHLDRAESSICGIYISNCAVDTYTQHKFISLTRLKRHLCCYLCVSKLYPGFQTILWFIYWLRYD